MIGYYAERIACQGCAGIVCTSGGPLVHAHGGVDRVLSTNPIAFGIPRGGREPIVFDMATSALSNARIRQAAYHGEQVPPGSGVGPDGLPTTDAATIRKGRDRPARGLQGLRALARHRDAFGAAHRQRFRGRARGGRSSGSAPAPRGHFMIAVSPAAFGDEAAFRAAVNAYVDEIASSRRASGHDPIRMPGDRAFAERERRLRDGIPVLSATWDIISEIAADLGVPMP